jgi:predicted MFS family arabinose efflux permease
MRDNRWLALTVLFLGRTVMAFQFQSVASVSVPLVKSLAIDYTALGTLIGLYMLPGFVIALPGGLLGQRFGDRRLVLAGLALMALGGAATGIADGFALAAFGRLVAGVGGVLLNVLLTKMVTDWFAGKEIVTAMGVYLSSWPLGISLGLVLQGPLAATWSWAAVMHLTVVLSLAVLVLVATLYRDPPGIDRAKAPASFRPNLSRRDLGLVILAGSVWMLFTVGFMTLLSFGPEFLTGAGYTAATASAVVSTVTWLLIPALPLGAFVAEWVARPTKVLSICLVASAIAIGLVTQSVYPLALFVLIGLLCGPPGSLIMALPGDILRVESRAAGMGVYWTVYYVGMAALLPMAGLSRDLSGSSAAPIWFAAAAMLAAVLAYALFRGARRL